MTAEPKPPRNEKRPATLDDYVRWQEVEHAVKVDDALRNLTETNLRTILNTANEHPFFQSLPDVLAAAEVQYLATTKSRLLVTDIYDLAPKPFDSIVEKSYRHNVVWNKKWPKAPKWKFEERTEWVTPVNWYRAFDDLVRTTIIARYIDGPQFVGERLAAHAQAHHLDQRLEARALDVGYYAYHFYVVMPVRLLRQDWSVFDDRISIEVQLTTQLQEAARELTHGFYAANRVEVNPSSDWKWEYRSERFRAAYIAHSLRLIEALIVELREGDDPDAPPEEPPALDQSAQNVNLEVAETAVASSSLSDVQASSGSAESIPAPAAGDVHISRSPGEDNGNV